MSFATIIATARAISSLLPMLHDVIDQVEALFPAGGFGAQKLEIAKHIIDKAIAAVGISETSFANIWPALENIIAVIVAFKKTSA